MKESHHSRRGGFKTHPYVFAYLSSTTLKPGVISHKPSNYFEQNHHLSRLTM